MFPGLVWHMVRFSKLLDFSCQLISPQIRCGDKEVESYCALPVGRTGAGQENGSGATSLDYTTSEFTHVPSRGAQRGGFMCPLHYPLLHLARSPSLLPPPQSFSLFSVCLLAIVGQICAIFPSVSPLRWRRPAGGKEAAKAVCHAD